MMSYWNLKPHSHPEIDGEYNQEYDIITIWLGNKKTINQIIKVIKHEQLHSILDSIVCETTEAEDHFIIDDLEGSGDL